MFMERVKMKDEYEGKAVVFRALSVESRLGILDLLAGRTLCVGALAGALDISQGAVSQHLRILKDAGLVESERRGCFIHYRVSEDIDVMVPGLGEAIFGNKPYKAESSTGRKECLKCARKKDNARSRRI